MIRVILALFFLLPLQLAADQEEPPYIKLADQIVDKHVRDMEDEGYVLYMSGGGFFHDVEQINLGFRKDIAPTIDEARILYVQATQKLLNKINNDSSIQLYLHNRPFTIDNLYYQMSFKRVFPRQGKQNSVAYVSVVDGTVWYATYRPNSKGDNPLCDLHSEKYGEAVKTVSDGAN